MLKKKIFIVLFALGLGCTTVRHNADPNVFYKRDMYIRINGDLFKGVAVAPLSHRYKFEITAKGKLDLFTFSTCHRDIAIEEAGEDGIFGNSRRVKYRYVPANNLEKHGMCPVLLGGYEKSRGRHSWGFVDFQTPERTVKATISCNGEVKETNGVSICQSKAGLIQKIMFEKEMIVSPDKKCPMKKTKGLFFEYAINVGFCVFEFMEVESGNLHRHSTFGYEKILLREL
jgi:hypothetical protein